MQPPMLNGSIFKVLLIGALLLALSACASKGQRANDAYVRAQQFMADGKPVEARQELLRSVAISDDLPEVWAALGQLQMSAGRLPDAFSAFNRADELRPGDPSILRSLAYSGYMIGATRIAQDATDRLLVLASNDPQGLAVKGLLALDKGDTSTTMDSAQAILQNAPNDETGLLLKSRALAVGGKIDEAISLLNAAGQRPASRQSNIDYALLQLYRAKGDANGMQSVFPSLVEKQADNLDLSLDYCNFLYRIGKPADARKIWSDTVAKASKDGKFIAWAFEVYDNNEPKDQPTILDDRLTRFGGSPLRSAAGQYLVTRKEFVRAAALLSQGNGVADNDRGLYAVALEGAGRHAEAQQLVSSILSGANGRQDPNALMLSARWAIATKNYDRANADAQNAIIADPSNLEARLILAQSYQQQGQPLRVRQVLAQAVRDLPRSRRALSAYLQFLQSVGDALSAIAAARSYGDANLSDPWGWAVLTMACQKVNDAACLFAARKRYDFARRDFTFTNPSRPFKMRGLFSPLPAVA